MASQLVCKAPRIWVFDDMFSEGFLGHVDELFKSKALPEQCSAGRSSRSVALDLGSDPKVQELFDVIRKVSGVREVDPCSKALVSDVTGAPQSGHVDHVSLRDLSRNFAQQKLDFVDWGKQSESAKHPGRIVPTFSIVIYFNDIGGIVFPHADIPGNTISGKRGRIVMFQNYIDSQRPAHNPLAMHYGTYFEDTPKRVMTMGIIANETPSIWSAQDDATLTEGLIYCPGIPDEPLRHDFPSYGVSDEDYFESCYRATMPSPPKTKDDLVITLEADFDDAFWQGICRNVAGEEVFTFVGGPSDTLKGTYDSIVEALGGDDKNVKLCTYDGKPFTDTMIESFSCDYIFGEQKMLIEAVAAAGAAQAKAISEGKTAEEAEEIGKAAAEAAKDAHYEGLIPASGKWNWGDKIKHIQKTVPGSKRRSIIDALLVAKGGVGHAMDLVRTLEGGDVSPSAEFRIKRLFERADANLDGWLSKQELSNVLVKLGEFSADELDVIFQNIDVNKDGRLQYGELIDWCFKMGV